VPEAAQFLSLSVPVLRLWIRQDKLPCVRAGRRVLLHPQVLEERAASGALVTPPARKARTT
jgi:excisionase family DNA binding protein